MKAKRQDLIDVSTQIAIALMEQQPLELESRQALDPATGLDAVKQVQASQEQMQRNVRKWKIASVSLARELLDEIDAQIDAQLDEPQPEKKLVPATKVKPRKKVSRPSPIT